MKLRYYGGLFLSAFIALKAHAQSQPIAATATLQTPWATQAAAQAGKAAYPRPQLERKNWQSLNGTWSYTITGTEDKLPSSWQGNILVPFPLESVLSGVQRTLLPKDLLWYKRTFQGPAIKAGEKLLLNFGAVDQEASVYLNGQLVGSHSGGYTAFSFDITSILRKGTNEIIVKVADPSNMGKGPHGKQVLNPQSIYYTPTSGIWQTVWLETVPADHISELNITPDLDRSLVHVVVHAAAKLPVTVTAAGKVVQGHTNSVIDIHVPDARLWSPEDPYLYDLKVKMGKDEVKSYFGMRKISIQKDAEGIDRIFLNNKAYYNLGVLDQGFWPDGLYTAPTDEALAFDIKAIKSMGFNTIRKHIKVEPARWYYYTDKLGMLVWQDMVNPHQHLPEGAKQAFEQNCKETIQQLKNHPSITTWVLFNEKWGQYDQQRLTNWIKQTDPSRLVNGHSGEYLYVNDQLRSPSPNAYVDADMTDVHSYPYPRLAEKQAGKAMVCGEFGGIGVPVPGHEWTDLQGWGYIQVTAAEMKEKYALMTKQMVDLKKQGLSASIYTQPFDVEGEENGLFTYDRKVIKMSLEDFRKINGQLIDLSKGFAIDPAVKAVKVLDTGDNDNRYAEFLSAFNKGQRDSAFLRRFTLMALRKKEQEQATRAGNEFIAVLKDPFSKNNLTLISNISRTSADKGTQLILDNAAQVDKVLGPGNAARMIRKMIKTEFVDPILKDAQPDWDKAMKGAEAKYRELGKEK
ncbi:MAG: glycoside hydrolase family 2, partial [Chitinophagaceae bacterium]|nr:glycoside hydrolase family 2 [Chitinophagaceae bacterium]